VKVEFVGILVADAYDILTLNRAPRKNTDLIENGHEIPGVSGSSGSQYGN